jgi:ankyrin repeat protein
MAHQRLDLVGIGEIPQDQGVVRGGSKAVHPLLEKKASPNIQSSNGRTVLHVAAEKEHATVVELLLQKGAELDSKDKEYGQTALHVTAENGHEAVLKLLIEKDSVDPDSKYTFYSWTPLWWAAANGYEAVVKLLLEKGADLKSL